MTFHEDNLAVGTQIRGAFFTTSSPSTPKEEKLLDVFIMDPDYKIIHFNRQHEEGIFRFNTTIAGSYHFVFSNAKDKKNMK